MDQPLFWQDVFSFLDKKTKKEELFGNEYTDFSRDIDVSLFQESISVRNVLETRKIATTLIDEKGELRFDLMADLVDILKKHLYPLGPDRQNDALRREHLLKVLHLLLSDKEIGKAIKKIHKPYSHRFVDQIIRDTLHLPPNTTISDAHARQAALSAWMCYLRQNVGSCFATAPAIIIHEEQPLHFLNDLNEIIATGRLKRIFGGIEYSVPLSFSWGAGDLKKPILLLAEDDLEENKLYLSPALLASLESIDVINAAAPLKEKQELLRSKMITFLQLLKKTNSFYYFITAEEIIRHFLLLKYDLSEKMVKEYIEKPQGLMMQGNLLLQVPKSSTKAEESYSRFFQESEKAMNVFKGFADNPLLKIWEFTLASFAETKADFTRWNLYSSLGLGPREPGGIGECLYGILTEKLERVNQQTQEIQIEYEQAFHRLKSIEARINQASTEQEVQWLKAEYQAKRNEFYTREELREKSLQKAKIFAHLFDYLISAYIDLFQEYFQEVYDADLHEVKIGPYDDSPAGFRLIYKHGRGNTSQWTQIQSPSEFIDMLVNFFTITENQLVNQPEMKGIEHDFGEIVTAIVNHIRTTDFIESAFYRMAVSHHTTPIKNPLENLEKIEKKPWVYTSGGTMNTLVSCYYKREEKPTEINRFVESDTELLVFLLDILKQIPPKIMQAYEKDQKKGMLMHSPTHAFVLKPGLPLFKELWISPAYTYTWLRDQIILPAQQLIEKITLSTEMQHFFIQKFAKKVPKNFQSYFLKTFANLYSSASPSLFRKEVMETIEKNRGLQLKGIPVLSAEEIDSILFSSLPLTENKEVRLRILLILQELPQIPPHLSQKVLELYDKLYYKFGLSSLIDADSLQNIIKSLIGLSLEQTSTQTNFPYLINQAAQKLQFALPSPVLIADSNWVKDWFGFTVNPGTGKFEFWRMDYIGRHGYPMSIWEQWLNGSKTEPKWGLYTVPYEYS